mgnify:CR=1 FL=1
MRKILFFLSSFLLVTLLSAGCIDQKCEHLYIISTNDIHSTIDAFPRLATLVAEYEAKGEKVFSGADAFRKRVVGYLFYDSYGLPRDFLFCDILLQILSGFYSGGAGATVSFYKG